MFIATEIYLVVFIIFPKCTNTEHFLDQHVLVIFLDTAVVHKASGAGIQARDSWMRNANPASVLYHPPTLTYLNPHPLSLRATTTTE